MTDTVFTGPKDAAINEYVHWIGRTGRKGQHGRSTAFFDPYGNDERVLQRALVKVGACGTETKPRRGPLQILMEANQIVPPFFASHGADFTSQDFATDDEDWTGSCEIT